MTLLFAEKSQAAAGGSDSKGLPPDVAHGWVGAKIKITKAVLLAMND